MGLPTDLRDGLPAWIRTKTTGFVDQCLLPAGQGDASAHEGDRTLLAGSTIRSLHQMRTWADWDPVHRAGHRTKRRATSPEIDSRQLHRHGAPPGWQRGARTQVHARLFPNNGTARVSFVASLVKHQGARVPGPKSAAVLVNAERGGPPENRTLIRRARAGSSTVELVTQGDAVRRTDHLMR